jgi:cytochrome c biogenesis protein CcmG/thiol:disulfide interchange protein DsbE
MLKNVLIKLVFLLGVTLSAHAQKRLPDVFIENLQRQNVSATEILNPNGPAIISFWATWCKPCLRELQAINAELEEWTKATNVKLVAISTDDARTQMRVPALVKSKKWNFDIYVDPNGDLQRSMNILSIPYTIILNKNGEIIYQQSAYAPGDEAKYFEVLKGLE